MTIGQHLKSFFPIVQTPTAAYFPLSLDHSLLDASSRKFNFGVAAVVNTGAARKDVLVAWGYNANAGGGKQDATEHCLHYGIEDYYFPLGSNPVAESYLNYVSAAGVSIRPFLVCIDLINNQVDWNFYTSNLYFRNTTGVNLITLVSGATAALSSLAVACPTKFPAFTGFGTSFGADTPQSELHVSKGGGSCVITTDYDVTFNHYNGTWGANATRPYIKKGWVAGLGGYLYIGVTGNASNTGYPAIAMGNVVGITFGKGSDAADSLSTEWARINAAGNLLLGTATDGMTAAGSLAIAKDLAHRGTLAGLFNHAPVTQQAFTAVSNPPTQAEVTAIRNALVNLGIMAAS